MKAIFLDIDGVLNSTNTKVLTNYTRATFLDPDMILRLKRIIEATDAKVVLSSDWRYDKDDERYNQDFIELRDTLKENGIEFYGFTPERIDGNRGFEIAEYILSHDEFTNYVVLDDRPDACIDNSHFVRTLMSTGLTEEHVEEAIKILND